MHFILCQDGPHLVWHSRATNGRFRLASRQFLQVKFLSRYLHELRSRWKIKAAVAVAVSQSNRRGWWSGSFVSPGSGSSSGKSPVVCSVLFDLPQSRGRCAGHRHASCNHQISDAESCNLPVKVLMMLFLLLVPGSSTQVPGVPLEAEIQN
jgi:hypothetical protein